LYFLRVRRTHHVIARRVHERVAATVAARRVEAQAPIEAEVPGGPRTLDPFSFAAVEALRGAAGHPAAPVSVAVVASHLGARNRVGDWYFGDMAGLPHDDHFL